MGTSFDEVSKRSPQNEKIVSQSFEKARSTVHDYAQLMAGHGYQFHSLPAPVQGVGHAKKPLIPMMISIVPPTRYPQGTTTTKKISSPMSADVALTSVTERFKTAEGQTRYVQRIIPTDPAKSKAIDTLEKEIAAIKDSKSLTPGEKATQEGALQAQIVAIRQDARFMEVEVPSNTPAGSELQVARTQGYLTSLRDRYSTFQTASLDAATRFTDMNSPITGGSRKEVRDPYKNDTYIKDARKKQVVDDISFLREQAILMQGLPPLFMYVNPTTFTRTYEHIVSDDSHTRQGHSTVEFWGEQQVKISATGQVGAFYVEGRDKLGNAAGGLAVTDRRASYAYQQFMSLYQIYRNNGYIYNTDERISLVGAVAIFYDGVIYTGSFDSLSMTHSADKPFTFDYNFAFTVRFEQRMSTGLKEHAFVSY